MSPLYRRLLFWFCLANIVTLFVSVFVVDSFVRRAYPLDPDWAAVAQSANESYQHGGKDELADWIETRHHEGLETMLFEDGRNLVDRPLPPPAMAILPQLLLENSIVLRPRPDLRMVGERVVGADSVVRQLVAMRGPRPAHGPRFETYLSIQIGLSLLAIVIVGWLISRTVARPVAALREATQRMAAGELSARVGPRWTKSRDELGALSRDFDGMATRIESLVAHERSVLQDLSHELRSPLARLHLILDLAQHGAPTASQPHFQRAENEITRLDRMIGEMLALSRMEADLPGMERERVDLKSLAAMRVDAAAVDAQPRLIALHFESPPDALYASGSHLLLERALDNLLGNAIKFSADGAAIEVRLGSAGGTAEIAVRDYGPGVPAEELENLFRPFFRGANATRAEGHGLGLSIVERILRAHGGTVIAENAEGGGLRVRVRLPQA